MSVPRKVRLLDPQTGRAIIVYQEPLDSPLAPQYYPPPAVPEPRDIYYERPRPRERRKRAPAHGGPDEGRGRLAGGVFAAFIASWVPCAVGAPGLTILSWGLIAAYLLYRAIRR